MTVIDDPSFVESLENHEIRSVAYRAKFCQRVLTPDAVSSDAITFCGLFDAKHRWAADFMREYGREELINLQMNFDMKMLELDAQDRIMVIQLTSQRYVGMVDDAVERIAIALHGKQIDSQRSRVAAREYAMTQDRRRVETMQRVVANALARSAARIKELDAQIATLLVDGEMVQAEILQKELEVDRAKLAYLQAMQRGLQVQQDIADIGLQRAKTESEVAKIASDVVQWDVRLAENASEIKELLAQKMSLETRLSQVSVRELEAKADTEESIYRKADIATKMIELQSQIDTINAQVASVAARTEATHARAMATSAHKAEVGVQIAQTNAEVMGIEADIIRADVDIARTRLSEADALVSEAEAQIENKKATDYWPQKAAASLERAAAYDTLSGSYASLVPLQEQIGTEMIALQTQRYDLQVQDIGREDDLYALEANAQMATDRIRIAAAKNEADAEIEVSREEGRVWGFRKASIILSHNGAIEAARILSGAEITNNLTHTIGGA